MADRQFEIEIDRLFGEAVVLPDADRFAAIVAERLERGWRFRRLLIGGMGALGGVIGSAQLVSAGLLSHVGGILTGSNSAIRAGFSEARIASHLAEAVTAGAGLDTQVLWMSAAMAVVATILLMTRAIRDI